MIPSETSADGTDWQKALLNLHIQYAGKSLIPVTKQRQTPVYGADLKSQILEQTCAMKIPPTQGNTMSSALLLKAAHVLQKAKNLL